MLTLVCVVVGEGRPFSVKIEENENVGILKNMIWEQNKNTITCDAKELELYLARNGLSRDEARAATLDEDGNVPGCIKMDELLEIQDHFEVNIQPEKGKIYVLVVVPAESHPSKKQRVNVGLRELCRISSQNMKDLKQFPNVDELRDLLLRPLPFQVKVVDPILWQDLFATNAQRVKCEDMTMLVNAITSKSKLGQNLQNTASENSWQPCYDVFLDVTESLCIAFDILIEKHRNKADTTGTTARKLRPDCLICTKKGLVLLRGEEKSAMVDINTPLGELTTKMTKWNPIFYGELPYTLGYATSGDMMSIVAIDRHDVHDIISEQSVLKAEGRVNLLKIFYNLAFFFELMEVKSKRTTTIRLMPFVPDTDKLNRTIELVDTGIRRTYVTNLDRMTKIYAALKKINQEVQSRTHLQIVSDMKEYQNKPKLMVLLTPLGFERQPLTIQEVRDWLFGMLTALSLWHGSNYCHGDIRWRNIVFVPTEAATGYWMLLDMDESYSPNTRKIDWNHQLMGETLTYQHDFYQLGKLLSDLNFELPMELKNLLNALLTSVGTETTAQDLFELL